MQQNFASGPRFGLGTRRELTFSKRTLLHDCLEFPNQFPNVNTECKKGYAL